MRKMFLNVEVRPGFIGRSQKYSETITFEGGKTWNKIEGQKLFGSYFFLKDDVHKHQVQLANLVWLLSTFGGLLKIINFSFSYFGELIN